MAGAGREIILLAFVAGSKCDVVMMHTGIVGRLSGGWTVIVVSSISGSWSVNVH